MPLCLRMGSNEFPTKSKTAEIPFFPSNLHEKLGNVSVWWFERNFCQSFYGTFGIERNSCMLIMLLIAARIRKHKIEMKAVDDQLPFILIKAFARSILEGNEIYCNLSNANKLQDVNLSIPDAIRAVRVYTRALKEWFYASIHVLSFNNGIKESIFTGLTEGFYRWKQCNSARKTENKLFVILIASKQSILFVFEDSSSTVTIFESHEHLGIYGSIIAQTDTKNLFHLCRCIERLLFDANESCPYQMELSFLECNEQNPLLYIRKFVPFSSHLAD